MKIGIIVAMDKEMQQLQHLFNDGDVIVKKCGIGKVNAALGAAEMTNTILMSSSPQAAQAVMATTSTSRT